MQLPVRGLTWFDLCSGASPIIGQTKNICGAQIRPGAWIELKDVQIHEISVATSRSGGFGSDSDDSDLLRA